MNKKIAVLTMVCLAVCLYVSREAQSSACVSVDKSLNMTFPCVQYQGQGYGFTLKFSTDTDAPNGFYLKMDPATVVKSANSSDDCMAIADNLQLKVSCAEYNSLQFGFILNFYSNPKDAANLYWTMDVSTLEPKIFTLSSSAFSNNQTIPTQYSCDGSNISPPLSWTNAPSKTKSFVLIMDDPEAIAVVGKIWDHWIVYDIPASVSSLAENAGASGLPSGAKQGTNSVPSVGYSGPCPPQGSSHHYLFKIYALDVATLGLGAGATKADVEAAMENHKLGWMMLVGTYPKQ